ncbi:MAG: S8 family serine peptidase, partial [Myxococcota bacterium]
PFTNRGSGIDVMAPGGNLDVDADGDGIPDGILAESIHPDDPADVGLWLMAGSSQAAATVTGLAALGRGRVTPEEFRLQLQSATCGRDAYRDHDRRYGFGAGLVSLECGQWALPDELPQQQVYASVLPFLVDDWGEVTAMARVTLRYADGSPLRGAQVFGTSFGSGWFGSTSCVTDASGQCTMEGDCAESGQAMAFSFSVDYVQLDGFGVAPLAAMSTNGSFDDAVAAMRAHPAHDALLAWSFGRDCDNQLGLDPEERCVAASLSIVNSGSGLKSIPLGLVMSPEMVDAIGRTQPVTLSINGQDVMARIVSLDGSGLKSIPLGFKSLDVLALDAFGRAVAVDGSGLKSIPLGFESLTLPELDVTKNAILLDGSGLKSIPLGFTALDVTGGGQLVPLDGSVKTSGTALGQYLLEGGWQKQGYPAASVFTSSSVVAQRPTLATEMAGDAQKAVPFEHPR